MTDLTGPSPDGGRLTELMLKAANKADRKAFNELVPLLSPRLIRSAHHMVQPCDTEDLVQETWLRAWKYRHTYRGDAHPSTWLHTIMVHVAVEGRAAAEERSRSVSASDRVGAAELACVRSPSDFEALVTADAIDRALAHLDRSEAMIIRRRHLAEQDWTTITREMHFTSSYEAKKTYKLAMHKLQARQLPPSTTKPGSTI